MPEKIKCYMCGVEIKKKHPPIIEIKKYGRETLNSPLSYLSMYSCFVCNDCANNMMKYIDEKYKEVFWLEENNYEC